jgi:hypothetical protein
MFVDRAGRWQSKKKGVALEHSRLDSRYQGSQKAPVVFLEGAPGKGAG